MLKVELKGSRNAYIRSASYLLAISSTYLVDISYDTAIASIGVIVAEVLSRQLETNKAKKKLIASKPMHEVSEIIEFEDSVRELRLLLAGNLSEHEETNKALSCILTLINKHEDNKQTLMNLFVKEHYMIQNMIATIKQGMPLNNEVLVLNSKMLKEGIKNAEKEHLRRLEERLMIEGKVYTSLTKNV